MEGYRLALSLGPWAKGYTPKAIIGLGLGARARARGLS